MFASVKGYYDGKKIVMEEDVELEPGQEVIVTIINRFDRRVSAGSEEKGTPSAENYVFDEKSRCSIALR